MRTKTHSLFVALAAFLALTPGLASAAEWDPNFVVSDRDVVNKDAFSLDGIQQFLESKSGTLATYVTEDLDGVRKSASEIIHRVSQEFIISPKFILTKLQKEQSLVTDPDPVPNQYGWATGYAVCDSCNVNDSGVSRFKGFAKQIDSMARQFRQGYLPDLEENGQTQTGIAPGRPVMINGVEVTPANDATAAMYTYTPHLEGNRNFWTIYNNWFDVADYPSGTLLRNVQDGTTWLVKFGRRRLIESNAILMSFYDPNLVIEVDAATISAYEEGRPISYPNYSLVRVENGDVYLIVNDQKRRFVSTGDLPKFGYQPEEILDGTLDELDAYENGDSISYNTAYPQGVIYEHPETGSMFYVYDGVRHAIVSDEIKQARYGNWRVRATTAEELGGMVEGAAITFPDGTLMMVDGNPTVYVVSDGKRRPIISESTFLGLGYSWDNIVRTTPAAVEVHLPGLLISLTD